MTTGQPGPASRAQDGAGSAVAHRPARWHRRALAAAVAGATVAAALAGTGSAAHASDGTASGGKSRVAAAAAANSAATVLPGIGGTPTRRLHRTAMTTTSVRAAAAVAPEGSFVSYQRKVFKIVGGSTLYVGNWAVFGGPKPVKALTAAQWGQLYQWPLDGTFVQAVQSRAIYRFAGGAPFFVSTWSAFGGTQRYATIDQVDIDHAGQAFPYDGVAAFTQDSTALGLDLFVRGGQTGRVYKMAGGAPLWVSSWAPFGGAQPVVVVDQAAIDRAGQSGVWRFVRRQVPNGWWLEDGTSGEDYDVAGGAPIYISDPTLKAGWNATIVDGAAMRQAGSSWWANNISYYPATTTFLRGAQTGRIYAVSDGTPAYVSSWAPYGGAKPYTNVDQTAVDNAGQGDPWNHLKAPAGSAPAAPATPTVAPTK